MLGMKSSFKIKSGLQSLRIRTLIVKDILKINYLMIASSASPFSLLITTNHKVNYPPH